MNISRLSLRFGMARALGWTVAWLIALGCAIWAVAAIYHDFPAINVLRHGHSGSQFWER